MYTTHIEWLTTTTGNDSLRSIAKRADINTPTLSRQLKQGVLRPDIIIKIAQAYDESPVIALVDLGYISARWLSNLGTRTRLSMATDEELTTELLRRLQRLPDKPVDQLINEQN